MDLTSFSLCLLKAAIQCKSRVANSEHYLCDWSPDGRRLAYVDWNLESGADLWTVDLDSKATSSIANSKFMEKQADIFT